MKQGQLQEQQQVDEIQQYYKFQSTIYDWTRWSFLFGRKAILQELPFAHEEAFHLLEVGCGTGHNLRYLAKYYPEARLTGMDVSTDMLRQAKSRLTGHEGLVLLDQPYQNTRYTWTGKLDAVLFSYALSMINPQWSSLIVQAYKDLKPGGIIAVVDFHDSRYPFFKRHMGHHHVRMDSHLLPVLADHFLPAQTMVNTAYLGLWQYMIWIGKKL